MSDLGRTLIFLGLALLLTGLALVAFSGTRLPLGRLPGDLNWRGANWSVSFPIVSCLLLSALLSLVLWIVARLRR